MEITKKMRDYEAHLRQLGFADRTIESYVWVAAYFERTYASVEVGTLRQYRDWLILTFKPSTANQRIQAINCYLGYLGKSDLKLRSVRVQYRTFLDNAIDDLAFQRLENHLRDNGHLRDYHAIRIMATTGVRVSELLQMEVRHLRDGYLDINSKGKIRRVCIPDGTALAALEWIEGEGRADGLLFLNRYGKPLSKRGLAYQLKIRAAECGVDERLVHPHAFRRLFARRFLGAGGDMALLADLMGHSSVETTRMYLRRTASEQHDMLNKIISW